VIDLQQMNNIDRKTNVVLSRWSLLREANHLNTIRLDVMDLASASPTP
jgi:hypothetical protein